MRNVKQMRNVKHIKLIMRHFSKFPEKKINDQLKVNTNANNKGKIRAPERMKRL